MHEVTNVSPINKAAQAEKRYRQKIDDTECINREYVREIIDLKINFHNKDEKEDTDMSSSAIDKNNEDIAKRRISHLNNYRKNFNNYIDTFSEVHNSSEFIYQTRTKCCQTLKITHDPLPCNEKRQSINCFCKVLAKVRYTISRYNYDFPSDSFILI